MKFYIFFLNSILTVLLLCSCNQHNNKSANISFSIRNITYNNSNFLDSMRICNQANKQFLLLNKINRYGSITGSIFRSDSGNSGNDCVPYPILINNSSFNINLNNKSVLVKSAVQIDAALKSVMIAGITNDNSKIVFMPFDDAQTDSIIEKPGYDSLALSPRGDFIAGVSTITPNLSKDILLYNTTKPANPISVHINDANFVGSLFNIGSDPTLDNSPLILTGYQHSDNFYNAVLCFLKPNDTNANCTIAIPKYTNVKDAMPVNMFVAPDASIVYAVTNDGTSSSVVSFDPLDKKINLVGVSELTMYNINLINYVSAASRNDQGKVIHGGVISIFTSSDVGNPQYMMIFNQFGKYQVVPLALFLYNLGIKNPNNYQFISADPDFQYLLLKNNANFSSPGANSILYTVIKFNQNSSKFINDKFTDSDINARIALIESFLNKKE